MCDLVGIYEYVYCRWVECLVVVVGIAIFGFICGRIVTYH